MKDQPRIIVDTSVLIDGADVEHPSWRDAFTYLQGAYEVRAPVLIASEAGNIVHSKHPTVFGEDIQERARVLRTLLSGITRVPPERLDLPKAGELAETMGLTFYDSQFLALASEDDVSLLLTHDETLLEAGKEHLGDRRCLTLDEAGKRIAENAIQLA